jgi:hypothetical protein
MKRTVLSVSFALLLLTGCDSPGGVNHSRDVIERLEPASYDYSDAPENKFGFWEAQEQGSILNLFSENSQSARMASISTSSTTRSVDVDAIGTATPASPDQQIAYSYGFGFRIDGSDIAALQNEHIALCESMGTECRVIRTSQASSDNWDAFGELRMQVAATRAGELNDSLIAPAEELGGSLISSVRDGEDLTEQIIDTEARLQSRLVLRDKLTDILRRNRGSVDELVKAEKAVADVNQEIDATRSRLERFRNRVRFSDVRIEYEPNFGQSQIGFSQPVMTAFRSIGSTLGMTIGALIYLLTALVPIVALILGIRWLLHRFGLRLRFWRKPEAKES